VDYLEYPLMVPKDELLPHPTYHASDPCPEDELILLVQVKQARFNLLSFHLASILSMDGIEEGKE
jgi:hypothetical protein